MPPLTAQPLDSTTNRRAISRSAAINFLSRVTLSLSRPAIRLIFASSAALKAPPLSYFMRCLIHCAIDQVLDTSAAVGDRLLQPQA